MTADFPSVGTTASITIDITAALIDRFAESVGDDNPIHMDDAAARALGFSGRVAHGMSYASFVSTLIGTKLPGPGALWTSQTYRFTDTVHIGDQVMIEGTVTEIATTRNTLYLQIEAKNQHGKPVMEGESVVVQSGRTTSNTESIKARTARKSGPVALIAGAGGAIGQAIAARLAKDGFTLALCGRNLSNIEAHGREFPNAKAIALDLLDENSVRAGVEQAIGQLGVPDLIVHCATAGLPAASPLETHWDTFKQHFEIQVGGLHRLLAATAPSMISAGGGQFILIGSTATNGVPPKGLAAYTTGKAAASALTRSIAAELGPKGIRANIVSPHFIATPLTARVPDKARKLVAAQTPLRRLAEIEDVGAAVAFLAGGESRFINGHDMILDGGATMP